MILKLNDYILTNDHFWGVMRITKIETCSSKLSEDSPFYYEGLMYRAVMKDGKKGRVFYDYWDDLENCEVVTKKLNPEYFL